jgi:hypothetical protein
MYLPGILKRRRRFMDLFHWFGDEGTTAEVTSDFIDRLN